MGWKEMFYLDNKEKFENSLWAILSYAKILSYFHGSIKRH